MGTAYSVTCGILEGSVLVRCVAICMVRCKVVSSYTVAVAQLPVQVHMSGASPAAVHLAIASRYTTQQLDPTRPYMAPHRLSCTLPTVRPAGHAQLETTFPGSEGPHTVHSYVCPLT